MRAYSPNDIEKKNEKVSGRRIVQRKKRSSWALTQLSTYTLYPEKKQFIETKVAF
jgi:hypothetical protein